MLASNLRPGQLTWFAELFRSLDVTAPELGPRVDKVLLLFTSAEPTPIKLGLELVVQLRKAHLVTDNPLIRAAEQAMATPQRTMPT